MLAACEINFPSNKESSLSSASSCKTDGQKCKDRRKELSKMLLGRDRCCLQNMALRRLQIGIILIWKRHLCSIVHLLLVLLEEGGIDGCGRWCESGGGNEFLEDG